MNTEAPLQLLLFVDKRPSSREQIRQVRDFLKTRPTHYACDLQVIDVGEQPHLVEYFRLVATPALVKIHPHPRQIIAGHNIIAQLSNCWSRWQIAVEDYLAKATDPETDESLHKAPRSIAYSAELLRLSDEIFRLRQEKETLEEQLRFKDHILAMLAHDLRNPLTAASLALETLELSQDEEDPRAALMTPEMIGQLIRHARTQTRQIDRMITDILQAARGNQADLQVQPQVMDLKPLCLEVIERLTPKFQTKAQVLEVDIPGDLPQVYADRDWIGQVMVNLLDNAIKYTPESGQVQLSVLHRTTQKIQVSVCDNGPGIPKSEQYRIFQDQVRLKRDEAQEGYGIGLALCQRVIRAHYGQIWVDSIPGGGSCFHFTLPVYRS